jgi:hypothetical protein
MRSAPCALAPSHPLHVMPPRITRNSHRPRASDRTMVASDATRLACRSLKLDSIVTRAEKLTRMDNKPNLSREAKLQWAGSRERSLASGRGRTFFLTFLFIELIENPRGPLVEVNECCGDLSPFDSPKVREPGAVILKLHGSSVQHLSVFNPAGARQQRGQFCAGIAHDPQRWNC